MKYVLIGAGARGMIYAQWAVNHGHQIVALAEPRKDRREDAARILNVPADMCFADGAELLAKGKLADAAIIATMDRDHYAQVMQALDCGYDMLLEKPISPNPRECLEIEAKANALGRKITVCHVLRYTNFFSKLKEILDSKTLGKIVAIKHAENIGHWHMAHSFVRGNWRNDTTSSPIIMQKSCHDLDILLWLTGAHCTRVAAFGSLSYFKEENAPVGSAERCFDCAVRETCLYDGMRAYEPVLGGWPANVVSLEQTPEALEKALREGPYGRCVFRCDNNVCDHMSILMEFDDGVTATFSLTAQTQATDRKIHVMCEKGEIYADGESGEIRIRRFCPNDVETYDEQVIRVKNNGSGHDGGDDGIMEDFEKTLRSEGESRSSISRSVESHIMACAIEQARLTGQVVSLEEYRKSIM